METLFDFSPAIIGIVPLVIGLVEVAKMSKFPAQYAPILSIALGIAFVALTPVIWQAALVQGVIAGLAASGLWSGTKAVVKG